MTEARKEYLRNCPLHERYIRKELEERAKKIKKTKSGIALRLELIKKEPELTQDKYYMDLLLLEKKMLKIYQLEYKAVKRLLPQRKSAKKKLELKPCPFCGGKATIKEDGHGVFYPTCTVCDARIYLSILDRTKGIKAWNRRAKK